MRKEFSKAAEKWMAQDENTLFLTGDLGFMALENIRDRFKKRFINAGVCEQNMITMAAGLASEGFTPFCYSIAPFAVFRPAEQIRLDVGLHNMNVKIVGNGGGYGYGIMGATHHAIEDIAVVSSFQNFVCYIPFSNEDVEGAMDAIMKRKGPAYLRLGFGILPEGISLPGFQPIRKIQNGQALTVVAMGPVGLNVLKANELLGKENLFDFFIISEMPLKKISDELIESLKKTKKILVVEEHVKRGGMGEHLASWLMEKGISCQWTHLYAKGYPNKLYGSQDYHQKVNGLDAVSIADRMREIADER